MPNAMDSRVCGACFDKKAKVVEELFSDDVSAFARYSFLSRQGGSPALCQAGYGAYHVCHLRLPGEGKAA